MKTPANYPARISRSLSIGILAFMLATSQAGAIFNFSARRTLREADEHMETARKAEEEQYTLEACESYSHAYELYQKVHREKPNLKAEYVMSQSAECRVRIRTLFARAGSEPGDIMSPDEILPITARVVHPEIEAYEEAAGIAESAPADPATDQADSGNQPVQEDAAADDPEHILEEREKERIVRIESREFALESPGAETDSAEVTELADADRDRPRKSTWLGRLFSGREKPEPSGAEKKAPPTERWSEAAAQESSPGESRVSQSGTPETPAPRTAPPGNERALYDRIQLMLDDGAGAEAVLELEEIVESPGREPTALERTLLAQALINRHNYNRAESILNDLDAETPNNPSVKMLLAGVHMAKGRPIAALRNMDELVRHYPLYADAYVNLAYIRFAMDPAENREEAISYYRHALTLGAKRDPRLETELRVDINP